MKRLPLAHECSNSPGVTYWTCPGCYDDLPNKNPQQVVCEFCGWTVDCTIAQEPVYRATLVMDSEKEDD